MMTLYRQTRHWLESKGLWDVIPYLFFGVLTTVVNIVVFAIAHSWFDFSWPLSNSLAWLLSVLFAFVTNKVWVFHTNTATIKSFLWELFKFMVARVASYGLDMGSMFVLIDLLHSGDLVAKLITQVLVVVANYVLSKLVIFTER